MPDRATDGANGCIGGNSGRAGNGGNGGFISIRVEKHDLDLLTLITKINNKGGNSG